MSEVVAFRKRRGVELVMLILAMGMVTGTFVLTNLNLYEALPDRWWWGVGAYVAIGLAAHLVIRWRTPYADPLLFPLVYLLNGLGLAMIYRLDQRSQECEASRIQDRNFFMRKLEETQDQVAEAKAQVENLFERLVDERHHDRRKRNVPVGNDRRQSRWED